jgi:hypothetical protein
MVDRCWSLALNPSTPLIPVCIEDSGASDDHDARWAGRFRLWNVHCCSPPVGQLHSFDYHLHIGLDDGCKRNWAHRRTRANATILPLQRTNFIDRRSCWRSCRYCDWRLASNAGLVTPSLFTSTPTVDESKDIPNIHRPAGIQIRTARFFFSPPKPQYGQ